MWCWEGEEPAELSLIGAGFTKQRFVGNQSPPKAGQDWVRCIEELVFSPLPVILCVPGWVCCHLHNTVFLLACFQMTLEIRDEEVSVPLDTVGWADSRSIKTIYNEKK